MSLPEELKFFQNSRKQQRTTTARLDGKTCVVTGATSGIGYLAARKLAQSGAHIVMVCRNREKGQTIQHEITREYGSRVDVYHADFQVLSQVSRAASEIAASHPKIHVLVNNAGVFNKKRRLTPDGNEVTFGVIHLASFLLTKMLLGNLKTGAPARIIDINSEAHRFGGLNLQDLTWAKRPYIALQAYGAAKVAQLLTGMELAERLSGSQVTVNIMHPGEVRTNIGMNNDFLYRFYNRYILGWFLKDPAISANAVHYLAAAPELENVTGQYFNQTIEEKPARYILKPETRKNIWALSEQMIQPYLENIQ